jgi:hypothetical protein
MRNSDNVKILFINWLQVRQWSILIRSQSGVAPRIIRIGPIIQESWLGTNSNLFQTPSYFHM